MFNEFLKIVNDAKGNVSSRRLTQQYFNKNGYSDIWDWFISQKETFPNYIDRDIITLMKHGYTEPPKCIVCGKPSKINGENKDNLNFKYCSHACAVRSPERNEKISKVKKSYTDEQKLEINAKRESSMIEKYGVSYNSQRPEVKTIISEKLSKFQLNENTREKLLDKEWLYQEYVILNRSAVDIADELDIHYSTVLDYCRKYNFEITKHYQESLPQKQIYNFIIENYSDEVFYNDWSVLGTHELDIYIPELKLAIEYNGLLYHSSNSHNEKNKFRHIDKTNKCTELGIALINIRGDQWEFKRDVVKSIVLNKLNKTNMKIFARKCNIREVTTLDSRKFLDENHIQGNFDCSIKYGLYYNDELVSLMTFNKTNNRNNKNYEWELVRFCNKVYHNVVGGFSKLLHHFRKYHQGTIITYSDRSRGNGEVYIKNGFTLIDDRITIGYSWTDKHKVFSREKFQKHKLQELYDKGILSFYDEKLTEFENMFNNKYNIIYDCGQLKFCM